MKKNLSVIRGNTFAFNFIVDEEVEEAYFSGKIDLNKDNTDYLFQKTLENGIELVEHTKEGYMYIVKVAPEDTNNLDEGTYFYDLQIKINGDIYTPLIGEYRIKDDVTREV